MSLCAYDAQETVSIDGRLELHAGKRSFSTPICDLHSPMLEIYLVPSCSKQVNFPWNVVVTVEVMLVVAV